MAICGFEEYWEMYYLIRYITTPPLNNVGVSLAKKVGRKNVGGQLVVSATSIDYPCEQPNFQDDGRTRKDLEVLGQLQELTRSSGRKGLELQVRH